MKKTVFLVAAVLTCVLAVIFYALTEFAVSHWTIAFLTLFTFLFGSFITFYATEDE